MATTDPIPSESMDNNAVKCDEVGKLSESLPILLEWLKEVEAPHA